MTELTFQIDGTLVGDRDSIAARVDAVEESDREALRLVLSYLYLEDGPSSIIRDHKLQAEPHLTPVEQFTFQWLYKRTDGKLRRLYGPGALAAVKRSRYQCEKCGFADVRALHIEKTEDEAHEHRFACLCANCNTVEARAKEMTAVEENKARAAVAAEEKVVADAKAAAAESE